MVYKHSYSLSSLFFIENPFLIIYKNVRISVKFFITTVFASLKISLCRVFKNYFNFVKISSNIIFNNSI